MLIKLIAKRTVIGIFVIICLSLPGLFSQVQQEKISKTIKTGEPKSQFAAPSSLSYSASYEGTQHGERVGYILSGVGDVNGDGYDDFAIGNFHTNLTPGLEDKAKAGSVYLILGKSSGFQLDVDLENADAHFLGKNYGDAVGWDIGNRGDINGDGFDDILIGAAAGDVPGNPGHVFLVFGNASANWGNDFTLEDQADASFDGEANAIWTGYSVDIIGDLNDDGYDEFLIGAPLVDDEDTDRGKVYLFRGKAQGWQRHISVTEADAIFYGDVEGHRAGYSTKGVGDVNGDGIPDFAIGNRAPYEPNDRVFLLFGRSTLDWGTSFDLGDADVIFEGTDRYDGWAGWKIAPAGDVNGDDYDDILIGDPYCSSSQGKVFLIFGKSSGWSSISLNQADVVYQGSAAEQAGSGLGGNLDYDNDGLSDILIGAPGNSRNGTEAGEVYLVKGKRDGWQSIVNLNETYDYFRGEVEDQGVGYAVSSAGDFNRDGADDFVVSAPWNDDAGWVDFGKIYLFLGNGVSIPDIVVVPISKDYGSIHLGTSSTQTFTVSNIGTADLTVTEVSLSGEHADQFSIDSGVVPFTIATGETHAVEVSFNPSAEGSKAATLWFESNDPDENPLDVALTGNCYGIPDIAVDPTSKDYGDVLVSSTSSQTYTITNEGTSDLNVALMSLTGTNADQFSIDSGDAPFTLGLGEIRSVVVSFKPTSTGAKAAALRFESNDPDENPLDVALTGNCFGIPDIAVEPALKDYGDVLIGSTLSQTFLITNEGTAELGITSLSKEGADADQFYIDTGQVMFTLAPGEIHHVVVSFNPTNVGAKTAMLRFVCNDPDENPKDVVLIGKGMSTDTTPPYLTDVYPVEGASAIPKNTDIQFRIKDDGTGVNASFDVSVNGFEIVADGADQTWGRVTITSHGPSYTVYYNPGGKFQEGSMVTVRVQCQDHVDPANSLDKTYTFGVGTAEITITESYEVGQLGGEMTDGTTDVRLTFPVGALDDTTTITIATADNLPELPDSVASIGLYYHFGPDGIQFNDSVSIRVPFTDEDLANASVTDPIDIPVYFYSTSKGVWVRLEVLDADLDYIYVKVTEFCYLVFGKVEPKVGVEDKSDSSNLTNFMLMHNNPNPFNPETSIRYQIPHSCQVTLQIYNSLGQRIRTLVNSYQTVGIYSVKWDGFDDNAKTTGSGIYIYILTADEMCIAKKMLKFE